MLVSEPEKSYYSITLQASSVYISKKSSRTTFYDIFRDFGSLLSLTLKFTLLTISRMQGFSMHNSFIKRLYSTKDDKDNRHGQHSSAVSLLESLNRDSLNNKERVRDEIDRRGTFSGYKYKRVWCQAWFDKTYCCCCRPRKKREDFIFKDAKSKLNEEVDILEIVKKLRVH